MFCMKEQFMVMDGGYSRRRGNWVGDWVDGWVVWVGELEGIEPKLP